MSDTLNNAVMLALGCGVIALVYGMFTAMWILKQPDGKDKAAVRTFRKAILDSLSNPNRVEKWPVPYAARRIAWHALDHAWEIEDRSEN